MQGQSTSVDLTMLKPVSVDTASSVTVSVSEDATTALAEGASFGIGDFTRSNKGTNQLYSGTYYGYRYPTPGEAAFSVVVCQGYIIVHIPSEVAQRLSIDIHDSSFQQWFIQTLASIDKAASRGGILLANIQAPYYFTSDESVVSGDYTYRFGVEVEPGYHYTTVTKSGSEDGSEGALYCDAGMLTAVGETTVAVAPTGWDAFGKFLAGIDYRPLWVSLKTAGTAMLFIFVLGLLAAWGTIKSSTRFKGIFDTVFTIPMVLPPTVCGFLLLMFFGNSTDIGKWLISHGLDIVFTWPAAVIACVVVGFPLMYRTARGAFENLDPMMLDAARTLGWSETKVFARLMLPLAWPSIAAGTVLAFARAMGEFGATLFFAGNYAGITQTIPLAIYFQWMGGNNDVAIFWVIVVIIISFLIILVINLYASHVQRYRKVGGNGS